MEQGQIEEFVAYLKNAKGLGLKTIFDYKYWIKDFDLTQISQDYINEYVQKKGNCPSLRGAILNFLEYAGLKKTFDMPPKKTGRTEKRKIRGISHDEIREMRKYLYEKDIKKGWMFDLVYQGALRLFEVTSVKINSFLWEEWFENPSNPCKLYIMGKGKKERIVLINPETAESIINYCIAKFNLQGYEDINLFGKKPINLFVQKYWRTMFNEVWALVNNASTKAIGRKVRPHELRHARATELLNMGINERDIKNYLGHSNLATTEIYLHTSEKESIDNISNALKKL